MGGNELNFKHQKVNKKDFYKNKKIFKIKDIYINKILFLKINHMVKRIQKHTLLDIVRMSLDHCTYCSLK